MKYILKNIDGYLINDGIIYIIQIMKQMNKELCKFCSLFNIML